MNQCSNCKWFAPDPNIKIEGRPAGYCLRFPPEKSFIVQKPDRPITFPENYCGEHKENKI